MTDPCSMCLISWLRGGAGSSHFSPRLWSLEHVKFKVFVCLFNILYVSSIEPSRLSVIFLYFHRYFGEYWCTVPVKEGEYEIMSVYFCQREAVLWFRGETSLCGGDRPGTLNWSLKNNGAGEVLVWNMVSNVSPPWPGYIMTFCTFYQI